jgi:hypothetical protein
MRYGPRASCLFTPAERRTMSNSPTTDSTRPRKMTTTEIARAQLRLRRRLEDYLVENQHPTAEKRFYQAMIELLYCIRPWDSGSETIVDSARKLMLKPALREAFSRSTTNSSEGRPCVPSPSELFF